MLVGCRFDLVMTGDRGIHHSEYSIHTALYLYMYI